MQVMRQVVQSYRVSLTIDLAAEKEPNVEDTMRGIEWVLARAPQRGKQIGTSAYYLYRSEKLAMNRPSMTVLYTFDDEQVTLSDVWIHEEVSR